MLDEFKAKQVEFMKAKDAKRLDVLRFFLSQVKNKEIELRPQNIELTDEHVFKVLKKLIKQSNETIEVCEKGGRAEGLEKAREEKAVLEEFVEMFPQEIIQADLARTAAQQQKH